MLEFCDISFVYPTASSPALNHVSLKVAKGQRVALIGANGSGKSTLAKLANAILLPTSGEVLVDGRQVTRENLYEIRRTVGVVAQDPESQIVSATVLDDVAFGPENLGLARAEIAKRAETAIAAVGLEGKESREPHTLSGGEKQRLVIAGVLAMEPSFVVLDEPCSMLDATGAKEVREAINLLHARGCGIIHISHDLIDCLAADVVYLLDEGRVVFEGSAKALITSEQSLLDTQGFLYPPMLQLALLLQKAGVKLPEKMTHPAALAASVVRHCEGAC